MSGTSSFFPVKVTFEENTWNFSMPVPRDQAPLLKVKPLLCKVEFIRSIEDNKVLKKPLTIEIASEQLFKFKIPTYKIKIEEADKLIGNISDSPLIDLEHAKEIYTSATKYEPNNQSLLNKINIVKQKIIAEKAKEKRRMERERRAGERIAKFQQFCSQADYIPMTGIANFFLKRVGKADEIKVTYSERLSVWSENKYNRDGHKFVIDYVVTDMENDMPGFYSFVVRDVFMDGNSICR